MAFTVIRCFILYIAVWISVRIMGKRQIGELSPSELSTTILISELAAMPIQNPNEPILSGILPIFSLAVTEIIFSFSALKSVKARKVLYGKPVVLMYRGEFCQSEMARARVSVDDVVKAMRSVGCVSIDAVDCAILETSGNVSIIKKSDTEGVCELPRTVISDGKVIDKTANYEDILRKNGIKSHKDVFWLSVCDGHPPVIVRKDGRK